MVTSLYQSCHWRESDNRSQAQGFTTNNSCSHHSKNAPPGHRGATPQRVKDSRVCPQGGLDQRFTSDDYQRLQHLAKSDKFQGWLKIQRLPRSEAIGDQARYRVMVWADGDDGGGYRPIAGQLFEDEAIALGQQYQAAKDQRGFAGRVVVAMARIIEGGAV